MVLALDKGGLSNIVRNKKNETLKNPGCDGLIEQRRQILAEALGLRAHLTRNAT